MNIPPKLPGALSPLSSSDRETRRVSPSFGRAHEYCPHRVCRHCGLSAPEVFIRCEDDPRGPAPCLRCLQDEIRALKTALHETMEGLLAAGLLWSAHEEGFRSRP